MEHLSVHMIISLSGGFLLVMDILYIFSPLQLSLASIIYTTIECGAVFFDGSPLLFTPPVILLIQGISVARYWNYIHDTLL